MLKPILDKRKPNTTDNQYLIHHGPYTYQVFTFHYLDIKKIDKQTIEEFIQANFDVPSL